MKNRILVIIATADPVKAEAGMMYAVNSLKHGWMDDVKLVFFGPAEKALLGDPDMQELLLEFHRQDRTAVACRFLAERDGNATGLDELGLDVQYVGSLISGYIKDGYTPLVW
jgi:hypothetical protein